MTRVSGLEPTQSHSSQFASGKPDSSHGETAPAWHLLHSFVQHGRIVVEFALVSCTTPTLAKAGKGVCADNVKSTALKKMIWKGFFSDLLEKFAGIGHSQQMRLCGASEDRRGNDCTGLPWSLFLRVNTSENSVPTVRIQGINIINFRNFVTFRTSSFSSAIFLLKKKF